MPPLRPVVLAASAAAALVAAATALAGSEFTDPKGDSGGAPDVEIVQVGNDVVAGPVVLWARIANRTSIDAGDAFIFYINADLSDATGGALGIDYAIYVDGGGAKMLLRRTEAGFEQVPAPSLEAAFSEGGWLGVRIQPSELGGTRAFNFYLATVRGEDVDHAPDGDGRVWSYSLVSGPPKLSVEAFALNPKAVRAGRPLTASMAVWRDDVMDSLGEGKVTCVLKVRGKAVRASASGFGANGVFCRFAVPRGARGAAYTLTVTVSFGGGKATRTVSGRVR